MGDGRWARGERRLATGERRVSDTVLGPLRLQSPVACQPPGRNGAAHNPSRAIVAAAKGRDGGGDWHARR